MEYKNLQVTEVDLFYSDGEIFPTKNLYHVYRGHFTKEIEVFNRVVEVTEDFCLCYSHADRQMVFGYNTKDLHISEILERGSKLHRLPVLIEHRIQENINNYYRDYNGI